MSKQALKRVRKSLKLEVSREPLPTWAWPGGYPLFYIFADGGCICPKCANENIEEIDAANREKQKLDGSYHRNSHGGWAVDAADVNWEDSSLFCDHCSQRIESAYAEDEATA